MIFNWINLSRWHTRLAISLIAAVGIFSQDALSCKVVTKGENEWHMNKPEFDRRQLVTVNLALKFKNIEHLSESIMAVSTPNHDCYGNYWSRDDVIDYFYPDVRSLDIVQNWLWDNGIGEVHITERSIVKFRCTVAQFDKMFSSNISSFRIDEPLELRDQRYTIAPHLSKLIDFISFSDDFFHNNNSDSDDDDDDDHSNFQLVPCKNWIPFNRSSSLCPNSNTSKLQLFQDIPANASAVYVPPCINEFYNFTQYLPIATSGSRSVMFSYYNSTVTRSDLNVFQKITGMPPTKFSRESIGARNSWHKHSGNPSVHYESNLDVQVLYRVGLGLPITEYITEGFAPFLPFSRTGHAGKQKNEPFSATFSYLLDKPDEEIPQVVSISYADAEFSVPLSYAKRVCNMIGFLGLRGVSVLSSSGNYGVGKTCLTGNGKTEKMMFEPTFPASCIWVTSVGGTTLNGTDEVGWEHSSGGFSTLWTRDEAAYQDGSVIGYLKQLNRTHELSNILSHIAMEGRATPDISAMAANPNYGFVNANKYHELPGTSAACPVVAGIIALLNDARFRRSPALPAMGFINPWLYAERKEILRDITLGYSIGCGSPATRTLSSFRAMSGWDPVTGLGVPNFPRMLRSALAMKKGVNCNARQLGLRGKKGSR